MILHCLSKQWSSLDPDDIINERTKIRSFSNAGFITTVVEFVKHLPTVQIQIKLNVRLCVKYLCGVASWLVRIIYTKWVLFVFKNFVSGEFSSKNL